MRISRVAARGLALATGIGLWGCGNSVQDKEDVAARCETNCPGNDTAPSGPGDPTGRSNGHPTDPPPSKPEPDDGAKNGDETDVDCGGSTAPKCALGKHCAVDSDCADGTCDYAGICIDAPSCKPHLGGDTCGLGEVGQPSTQHESCCRTLPVKGYADVKHPGKKVYLDKYEITVGRVRAFLSDMTKKHGGLPNVRAFVQANPPALWDASWNKFLPADVDGEEIVVDRRLIGDPRGTWPGAPPVPPTDEPRKTGSDFQFNANLFVYLHGNNCSTLAPDSYGWPTWYYPPDVLAKMGPNYPPRANGLDLAGNPVEASEFLEVKSINCVTNALLAAFCAWDGGQLATSEVMDYVTGSPPSLGNTPGCGTQVAEDPPTSDASMKGGRCADLAKINATYDAGASLPEPNHPLNKSNYRFPFFDGSVTHDKAWQVAAPGRGSLAADGAAVDQVRIDAGDEPWMDLAGNLNEAVLATKGGVFSGRFGLKFRGLGYQSARSQLNVDDAWDGMGIPRIERAEAKAAFAGGRCMRFR